MNKIDYSGIVEADGSGTGVSDWDPPVHKFFGKKLQNGKMEKEPVYVHQEYPRLVYALKGNAIVAKIARTEAEMSTLAGEGWEKTPAKFGYVGAPDFEQSLQIAEDAAAQAEAKREATAIAAAAAVQIVDSLPRRGRPPKAAE